MTRPILLAYIRKSVLDETQRTNSPERQRRAIERHAGDVYRIEWFEDLDISGRHEANRPGWQRLLARMDDPQVTPIHSFR